MGGSTHYSTQMPYGQNVKPIVEGKQPEDEGHTQSNKAPKHSCSQKNGTKTTNQTQKAQKEAKPSTTQDWCDYQGATSARTGLARGINWQHAPAGANIREKTMPVEFTNAKNEKEKSRSRSGMVKLNKSLTLEKSKPQELIKQAKTKMN